MPDILIRGMEMPPENTFDIVYIYSDGSIAIPTWGKGVAKVDNLQAVELPPHGDLIGRDALKRKFCAHCDGYEYDTNACANGDQDCMDVEIIMNAPVVVPAERKKEDG